MATNITNKTSEVRAWLERTNMGRRRSVREVLLYINSRWPELDEHLRAAIYKSATE